MGNVPLVGKLIVPGLAKPELEGVPPGNAQVYVKVLLPQFVTVAVGEMDTGAHPLVMPLSVTVGFPFTVTVWLVVKVPHGFVTARVMV